MSGKRPPRRPRPEGPGATTEPGGSAEPRASAESTGSAEPAASGMPRGVTPAEPAGGAPGRDTSGDAPGESPADAPGVPDDAPGEVRGDAPGEPDGSESAEAPAPTRGLRARVAGLLRRAVRRPRTLGGVLGLIAVVGFVGVAVTLTGVELVHYSESVEFCTLCHTMEPQHKAYEASPHRNAATCGECHVAPGVAGFVKAKLEGTRELTNLVLNSYPTPIPPIEHDKLPSTEVTCQRCHSVDRLGGDTGPNRLVLRTTFAPDEQNTRRDLAVVLRPARAGSPDALGVHWHVETPVEFSSGDEHQQTIDTVAYTDPRTGEQRRFIAVGKVTESHNAGADVDRLRATTHVATMSCVTCHNRVGHDVRTADSAVDAALALGRLDPSLPFLKREAVALLQGTYAGKEEGLAAVGRLGEFYATQYPLVAQQKGKAITAATAELSDLFSDLVTPGMKTGPGTYPNNMGHQAGTGCFRCHDGAHYEVVDKVVTDRKIPSTCDTCHTFPQLTGPGVAEPVREISAVMEPVPLGQRPADHNQGLFAFDHAGLTTSLDGTGTRCASCHRPSYCVECHDSGAINVKHDQMLYNHAESMRLANGPLACAVCHQPAYCSQCHKGDARLGPSNSRLDGSTAEVGR